MIIRGFCALVAVGLLLTGCSISTPVGGAAKQDEGPAEPTDGAKAAGGYGTATITVGSESWTFDEVTCEGTLDTEFRLLAYEEDLRLGLFSSPDLGVLELYTADTITVNFASLNDPVVTMSGKQVIAEAEMTDWSGDRPTMAKSPGALDATCP